MPSNRQRFFAAVASVGMTLGGAWLASQVPASLSIQAATAAPAVEVSGRAGLSVEITGLQNSLGRVVVLVFDEDGAFADFDYRKAVGYEEVNAAGRTIKVVFPDLKSGPYAVTAFHDENSDRDLNMEGEIPSEGYAVSGAIDAYDDPSFAQAAVAAGSLRLNLHYFR